MKLFFSHKHLLTQSSDSSPWIMSIVLVKLWSCLTLRVLTQWTTPTFEGVFWTSVLLCEAPALADLAGTGLRTLLWPWRLDLDLGQGSLGRTGKHLVLQTGLATIKRNDSVKNITLHWGQDPQSMTIIKIFNNYCWLFVIKYFIPQLISILFLY